MGLFTRTRTAPELVLKCCNSYEELARSPNQSAIDHIVKYVGEMKGMLYGEAGEKAPKESDSRTLAVEAAKSKLLLHMSTQLAPLGFETRKDVAAVFSGLVRCTVDGRQPCVGYLAAHQEVLLQLARGYDKAETALITGSMLREALKHPAFAQYLLSSPVFYELLAFTDVQTFEVASDAFLTFKELLTRHAGLASAFLLLHSDAFFKAYNNTLLASTNYVTRRQSLKLLGELLLTSGNVEVMMRYIGEVTHLMLVMTLLRDPSRSIQFEAFHIFKVFVANPNKPAPVLDILGKNADRLLRFLSDFQSDREDEEFSSEKAVLCRVLREIQASSAV